MWRIAFRDLQWRRRRFLIALLATGLVFSLTLLMAATSRGIKGEARHILDAIGADAWLVAEGTAGPFTTTTAIEAEKADEVADLPGVRRADPLILLHTTALLGTVKDINLIGYRIGGIGEPRVVEGRVPDALGEAVADKKLGLKLGSNVDLSGHPVRVVGIATGVTFFYGIPTIFTPIEDTQQVAFAGLPIAMSIATRGVPEEAPPGLDLHLPDAVEKDLKRPLANGSSTIGFINVLLWLVATGIIGSIIYLSALERVRDFAVLKATGAATRSLFLGLAMQAIILSVGAVLVAIVLSRLLAPGMAFAVEFAPIDVVQLAGIALVIGFLSSLAGLRRAVGVDPALAFGGS
ncbi:MAG: putative transport system permease protein [Actinomycetota bacterium]